MLFFGLLFAGCADKSRRISSIDDLKTKRIGVLQGSVHDTYAGKAFPGATILQYKTPSDLVLAVKSGKIDAGIYSADELNELIRRQDEFAIVGGSLFSTDLGLGFHKDDDRLRMSFNRFLKQIRDNGIYDEMVRRWMKNGETTMPELPKSTSGAPLLVGLISDNGMPFTVVKDNRLTGYNIELLERFAACAGRKITYVDMDFGSLIAALASRKIGMIGAVLSITEERRKQIDFSDPYYAQGCNLFVLKKNFVSGGGQAEGGVMKSVPPFFSGIARSFESNILQENRWQLILDGLRVTVVISVFSTIIGTVLGALICFMRMSGNLALSLLAKTYISILRGTPVLLVLMMIFYVVFASVNIDPVMVAVIAFGMHFGAYAAEIFRSGIEGVNRGQFEAGLSMGFTRVGTFVHIVLPQAILRILPVYKGEFISLVKMTSIVGYIAVQDLTKASDIIRSRTFDAFFPIVMVAVLYFLISWSLMQSMDYLERKISRKPKRADA